MSLIFSNGSGQFRRVDETVTLFQRKLLPHDFYQSIITLLFYLFWLKKSMVLHNICGKSVNYLLFVCQQYKNEKNTAA